MENGEILTGSVQRIEDYGIFVDLGGVDGMVHISELSYARVGHPSEVVELGAMVRVKVLRIEQRDKGDRVALSMKEASDDPWTSAGSWLGEGMKLTGRVVRLAPFGAFVELQPGVEGLIHVSEMSWEKRIRHPSDVLAEGDQVDVTILQVDLESRRVGLSLKAALGDPWEGSEERYPVGTVVRGVVERIAEFGLFVKVEPGVVALIPMSELGNKPGTPAHRDFPVESEVEATVISVDEERRRLTLSRKADSESAVSADREGGRRQTPRRERSGGGGGGGGGGQRSFTDVDGDFATLGDLLKQQLQKRKG